MVISEFSKQAAPGLMMNHEGFSFRRFIEGLQSSYPNNMIEGLNDAIEIYFPVKGLSRVIYLGYTVAILLAMRLRLSVFRGKVMTNERIVEDPWVLQRVPPRSSVLNIGCFSSRVPLQLASLGCLVTGLDIRPYSFRHRNLTVVQGNLFEWEPERKYEVIVFESVIEHMGLEEEIPSVSHRADHRAIKMVTRWLAPGGKLLVTVPFGKSGMTPLHRIYGLSDLKKLFEDWNWEEASYFRRDGLEWISCDSSDLADISSPEVPANGVALLVLTRS